MFVFLYSHVKYGTLKQRQTVTIQSVHKQVNYSFALYLVKKCSVTLISPPTKLSNLNTQSNIITFIITFMIPKS